MKTLREEYRIRQATLDEPLEVLSLGGGVQSSAMALMADVGLLRGGVVPDCAIYANSWSDPFSTYEMIGYLRRMVSFPILMVDAGNLMDDVLTRKVSCSGKVYGKTTIPAYVLDRENHKGILQRSCTKDFKIRPIYSTIHKLVERKHGIRCRMWIGISYDEMLRRRPAFVDYIKNVYPLVEAGITREDCLQWMREHGHPEPSRSACVFCPFHSNRDWRELKEQDPEMFERVAVFEEKVQELYLEIIPGTPFLHPSRKGLREVDISQDKNNHAFTCGEGMCGV